MPLYPPAIRDTILGIYRGVQDAPSSYALATGFTSATTYAFLIGPGFVGTGAANSGLALWRWEPQPVDGLTEKLRLRVKWLSGNIASGAVWTIKMHQGAAGGANQADPRLSSVGTLIPGSTATITTPAAQFNGDVSSGDFDAPLVGTNCLLIVNLDANMIASSQLSIRPILERRWV